MTAATIIALHALLTAALYYLVARAEVTRFVWCWYPPKIDQIALCPACSGFWIGGAVAALGAATGTLAWSLVPPLALASIVTTPILWGAMTWGQTASLEAAVHGPPGDKGAAAP